MGVDLRLSDWTGGLTLLIERVVLMEGRSTERTDGDSVVLLQCRHEGRSPVVDSCIENILKNFKKTKLPKCQTLPICSYPPPQAAACGCPALRTPLLYPPYTARAFPLCIAMAIEALMV
jgi:hypothetical protein